MIVNYDEEMRKALESMKDAPYDYFESGCSFCGEAVEWALKTIDSQRTEIERLQPKVGKWVTVMHLPQNKEFKRCTCCDDICMGWDCETGTAYDYCPNCGAKMEGR